MRPTVAGVMAATIIVYVTDKVMEVHKIITVMSERSSEETVTAPSHDSHETRPHHKCCRPCIKHLDIRYSSGNIRWFALSMVYTTSDVVIGMD